MAVVIESGYSLPSGDEPMNHERIAHAGNWLTGGTVTVTSTATGYDADAPLRTTTYDLWKPDDSVWFNTWIYDHGSSAECDYCCIAAHDLADNGMTVSIAYWDGSAYQTLVSTVPTDNSPIFFIFGPQTSDLWRVAVFTAGGVAADPKAYIGVIKIGKAMQMQRPLYGGHTPANMARMPVFSSNYSETGQILGRSVERTMVQTSYDWAHLAADWVRSDWRPFQTALSTEPCFIAWQPDGLAETFFGEATAPPIPSNMGIRDLMSVSLSVKGPAYD